jgi:cation diffusion facilitator CzcD-associated flavoprotein CzcO/acetyl esterase/lipase
MAALGHATISAGAGGNGETVTTRSAAMMDTGNGSTVTSTDVVVVGAGFAGLYLLQRLRSQGMSSVVLECADGVGGTWYWNRYPGARCDIMSVDYSYSFDPELEKEWQWSEKYATQPEILAYANHVADKYDLRKDIRFATRVQQAKWDGHARRWQIRTDTGEVISCRFYVMASGCLSLPKGIDIDGADLFKGETYYTHRWPHEAVDLTGKRVAVIGTGSSGIQSIPIMAAQAAQLTVFQRTPNFSRPALNGAAPQEKLDAFRVDRNAYRQAARWSMTGVPGPITPLGALQVSEQERRAVYEAAWNSGDLLPTTFADLLTTAAANETYCEFLREKIRSIVRDPATADALCPQGYYYGTKRPCLDSGYFETFNRPHVRLIDLRKTPIVTITRSGIDTTKESLQFDAIVFATGFDAMTGALVAVDIVGRDGLSLKDKWAAGPKTYLGLMTVGFPNYFMITGPGSPSVLSNMMVSIEQHVEWVCDTISYMSRTGLEIIEPTETAEAGWVQHVNDCADITLFPTANSWYIGANVPGKPRVFLPYIGGVDRYRKACDETVEQGYLGFRLQGADRMQCNDGVIRRLQPDVAMMLEMIESLGLPAVESMSPQAARELFAALANQRPPGPMVGECLDGNWPGVAGNLNYRLYRPATAGPHSVVVYYHGGGWVLGGCDSDDPFCRDLCVRSDSIIVSVDYRHAPESPFPAAVEDAFAALQWVAARVETLGGKSGPVSVAGWSAGANLATVVCRLARDNGGPAITGQLLFAPVTDVDLTRRSYEVSGEGYVLTKALMNWFLDHYVDPAERTDPRVAPLQADDLSNLPPAVIVTCEFDPLSDEGAAYATALSAAGVDVLHIDARGHTHTSLTLVDVVISGGPYRQRMGEALRGFGLAGRQSPQSSVESRISRAARG